MRRTIFAVLVLANVGLLIWGIFYLNSGQSVVPAPEPSIAPEKMRKLDKKDISRAKARPRNIETENKPSVVVAQADISTPTLPVICYRLGPLSGEAKTRIIQEGIAGLPFVWRDATASVITGYRVYLPSFPSREDAERQRRELTQKGLKDHSLFQEAGHQNAVSLGLFSLEENARARIKALAEKGIDAKLLVVEQNRKGQWVDVGPTVSTPDLFARLNGLVDGMSGAVVREIPCVTTDSGAREPASGQPK